MTGGLYVLLYIFAEVELSEDGGITVEAMRATTKVKLFLVVNFYCILSALGSSVPLWGGGGVFSIRHSFIRRIIKDFNIRVAIIFPFKITGLNSHLGNSI
jgi:hypothetical protein